MVKVEYSIQRLSRFPGYAARSGGQILNLRTGRFLKGSATIHGYLRVWLPINGKYSPSAVHRLVAEAFLPPMTGKRFVNHKDADKTNNSVLNLEWCTHQENMHHAAAMGLMRGRPLGASGKRARSSTGVIGVYKTSQSKPYAASLRRQGRTVNLGCFYTIDNAHAAVSNYLAGELAT